ncbi:MAG: MoaD/ThiS family protein [Desulfobacterales bacterium]|nr:MAG: MoaD/ThiS family protein [Desulfobacterales bacterium]
MREMTDGMQVCVHLYPPLNTAAGQSLIVMDLEKENTIQGLIDQLVARFGPQMRRYLFDDKDRIIPGWCVFVNQQPPVYFNRPEALSTILADGDEVSFLLALAGG